MNIIPPITDPLGKHWDQPDVNKILIDDKYAVMDQESFDMLADYSHSMPSGIYFGKMWKNKDQNLLCWYGYYPSDPTMCSINYREILIIN